MTAHSRKEFAESRAAISEPGQNNADHAGAEKHGGKHQDARHFWHGLATQEARRQAARQSRIRRTSTQSNWRWGGVAGKFCAGGDRARAKSYSRVCGTV